MDFLFGQQLFFAVDIKGGKVFFDHSETHHLAKVLRKKGGDEIWVTNGEGGLFRVRLKIDKNKHAVGEIIESQYFPESQKKLHVFMAPPKSIDRFEWFLEKATELGVCSITPFFSTYSERKHLKTERLEKIIVSALKQSLRLYKPILNPPVKFREIFSQTKGKAFVGLCSADGDVEEYRNQKEASVIIGPEGGFSMEELHVLKEKGIIPIRFSENRLRTETAGVVAVCQFYNN